MASPRCLWAERFGSFELLDSPLADFSVMPRSRPKSRKGKSKMLTEPLLDTPTQTYCSTPNVKSEESIDTLSEKIDVKEEQAEQTETRRLPGHERIDLQVGKKILYQCTICRKELTSNEEEICHELKALPHSRFDNISASTSWSRCVLQDADATLTS